MEFVASHYFPQFERFLAVGPPVSDFGLGTISPLPAHAVVQGAGVLELHGLWLCETRELPPAGQGYWMVEPLSLHSPTSRCAAMAFALLWVCCTKVVSHFSMER